MFASGLYCRICGGSLRITGTRCGNGCCHYCHGRYCQAADHTLDIEKARAQHRARLLALVRGAQPAPIQDAGAKRQDDATR